MKLKDILAIAGKPGLYKFISQGRNGIIVESFIDGKRANIHSSSKVSALEDIAIYTDTEEVSLSKVFRVIYAKQDGKEAISHKSSADKLKSYFEEILADYDKDRVYVSDIKKVIHWYNMLIGLNLLNPDDPEEDSEEESKDETETTSEEDSSKSTKKEKE